MAESLVEIYSSLLAYKNHITFENVRFICTRFIRNRRAPSILRGIAIDFLNELA